MDYKKIDGVLDKTAHYAWEFLGIVFIIGGSYVLGMAFMAWTVSPMLDEPPFNLYHRYATSRMITSPIMISIGIVILSVTRLRKNLLQIIGISIMACGTFIMGMEFTAWTVFPLFESLSSNPFYIHYASIGEKIGFVVLLMGIIILVKGILIKSRNQNEQ